MKLKPEALTGHLHKNLLPLYWLSGDEPLLLDEAQSALRHAATARGFTERHRLEVDTQFEVNDLTQLLQNGSLFGDQKLIELHAAGKLPTALCTYLGDISARLPSDTVLILITPKLDSAVTKTKYYQAIEAVGCHITLWPIETAQLPQWLNQRARKHGITLTPEALQLLSDCVEGNLLAAAQLLDKVALQYPGQSISEEQLSPLLSDNSRYDVFEWVSAWLQGNAQKAWHILQKLHSEGIEPTLLVWALSKELRVLYRLHQQRRTDSLANLFQQHRIWPKRQPEFEAALKRISPDQCLTALQQLAHIDRIIKGAVADDPWAAFSRVIS